VCVCVCVCVCGVYVCVECVYSCFHKPNCHCIVEARIFVYLLSVIHGENAVCITASNHTRSHTRTRTCTRTLSLTHTRTRAHLHTHAHTYTHTHTHTRVHTYTHLRVQSTTACSKQDGQVSNGLHLKPARPERAYSIRLAGVALCCTVLHCVAVKGLTQSASQVLHCVALCCTVLHCVAVKGLTQSARRCLSYSCAMTHLHVCHHFYHAFIRAMGWLPLVGSLKV